MPFCHDAGNVLPKSWQKDPQQVGRNLREDENTVSLGLCFRDELVKNLIRQHTSVQSAYVIIRQHTSNVSGVPPPFAFVMTCQEPEMCQRKERPPYSHLNSFSIYIYKTTRTQPRGSIFGSRHHGTLAHTKTATNHLTLSFALFSTRCSPSTKGGPGSCSASASVCVRLYQ